MSGLIGNDITEQYLNKCYEDFSKEQMRLMTAMKNGGGEVEEKDKELDIQKQLTMLNSLMIGVLRFRNLRKKVAIKGNSV
jgi:hypothetical protein